MRKIVTSESVNCGHPDKTCDIIADAFLDEALRQDKNSQMAVECAIKDDLLMIYGEATTKAKLNYEKIAADILLDIGYMNQFKFIKTISQQSAEINKAVVKKTEVTANDQGIMYGYATNETPEFMPISVVIAHKLMKRYDEWRRGTVNFLADAKSQVSVEYDGNKPTSIHTILVSVSHTESATHNDIVRYITEQVVRPVLDEYKDIVSIENYKLIINPSGKFTIWGSFSDSGCVGRKIVVDTYGGVGRVGGGCFSSKNPTKVDRSAAYYARFVAKNIVAHGLAFSCEVSAAYAIGLAKPLKINIETFGSGQRPQAEIEKWVEKNFDFSVSNIIKELDLLKPVYKQTACFGHFGNPDFSWERIKK